MGHSVAGKIKSKNSMRQSEIESATFGLVAQIFSVKTPVKYHRINVLDVK